jgi:hypothetical protein
MHIHFHIEMIPFGRNVPPVSPLHVPNLLLVFTLMPEGRQDDLNVPEVLLMDTQLKKSAPHEVTWLICKKKRTVASELLFVHH